ncbi:hypothetical protein LZ32DRAFT_137556 [Colletotrichum eremochloae]|nr:hypothetical protein LZ32DRAFT_137556 [Colletotrichum eremochloae]
MQTLMHEFEPRHACPTSITANGHARETLRRYPSSCSRGGATPTAVMLPMQLHRTPTETYRTIPSCWSRKFQQDGKIGPLQTVVGGHGAQRLPFMRNPEYHRSRTIDMLPRLPARLAVPSLVLVSLPKGRQPAKVQDLASSVFNPNRDSGTGSISAGSTSAAGSPSIRIPPMSEKRAEASVEAVPCVRACVGAGAPIESDPKQTKGRESVGASCFGP